MWTKLLIIEDHDDFREMVKSYLKNQALKLTVLEASSAEIGIAIALREQPQIVLMDIRLPGMNGIEAAGRVRVHCPKCKVVILTMFETAAFKDVFKSEDISAYLGKSELYDKLVPTLLKFIGKSESAK
ncbi:MAG: response regulator transcription factor [Candidatus Omnitrophota bacterium]|nr:response regulator transcription factor [Candidatus Omnitrophota bacterium]MDZ4242751.1 response regulator transcription factor [Candidatus Omnitrophota bacterium]